MQIRNPAILAALLEMRGMRPAHLAAEVGCGRSFIGHLLVGRKTGVSAELGHRIVEVLNVPEEILFVPAASASSGSSSRSQRDAA